MRTNAASAKASQALLLLSDLQSYFQEQLGLVAEQIQPTVDVKKPLFTSKIVSDQKSLHQLA